MGKKKHLSNQWLLGATFLAFFCIPGCGLHFFYDSPSTPKTKPKCFGAEAADSLNTKEWSPELISELLSCSRLEIPRAPASTKPLNLIKTAQWLNTDLHNRNKKNLSLFLDSISPELGKILLKVSADGASKNFDWMSFIKWVQIAAQLKKQVQDPVFLKAIHTLSLADSESLEALASTLAKLSSLSHDEQTTLLRSLNFLFVEFYNDPAKINFLSKASKPLDCLMIEADQKDTSLISSGWNLLIKSKKDPITFAETFVQSYGLIKSFCKPSELPTPHETFQAFEFYTKAHNSVFLKLFEILDQDSKHLFEFVNIWQTHSEKISQEDFLKFLSAVHKILRVNNDKHSLKTFILNMASVSKNLQPDEIQAAFEQFEKIEWDAFSVPSAVLMELFHVANSHSGNSAFLNILGKFISHGDHLRLSEILAAITTKVTDNHSALEHPLKKPSGELKNPLISNIEEIIVPSHPIMGTKFLSCLKEPQTIKFWGCLKSHHQKIPYATTLMTLEHKKALFFDYVAPDNPGRWLGQGFFSPRALAHWKSSLRNLAHVDLPIEYFLKTFPFYELSSDERVSEFFLWLKNAPSTTPESTHLKNDLGIPQRFSINEFSNPTWLKWFATPKSWIPVRDLFDNPGVGPKVVSSLKKLSNKKISLSLYRSDTPGLYRTAKGSIGMLSALDILLWEIPYDWARAHTISQILNAKSPRDLLLVLHESKQYLDGVFWALDSTPLTKGGALWKKAKNAQTLLDATIALKVETELYDWSLVMKALSGTLPPNESVHFLTTLHKTGIISSISHTLHDNQIDSKLFSKTLMTVFYMIHDAKASPLSWYSAVFDNQKSHGLFVYSLLSLCSEALHSPYTHYQIKLFTSLVKTGSHWSTTSKTPLPFKAALDALSGPTAALNPWIWIFLKEVQTPASEAHDPWMRILLSLEPLSSRREIYDWIETGIPENIGSWMDAMILAPSNRF